MVGETGIGRGAAYNDSFEEQLKQDAGKELVTVGDDMGDYSVGESGGRNGNGRGLMEEGHPSGCTFERVKV